MASWAAAPRGPGGSRRPRRMRSARRTASWHTVRPNVPPALSVASNHSGDRLEEPAVTEPEDRESKSSTPKPPDTLGGNLPPRLREKLMEAAEKDSGDGMGKSPVVGLTLAVLVIGAVVGFVWWLIHSDQVKKAAEAARAAASARAIAAADSLDAAARADSLAAAARADSIAF